MKTSFQSECELLKNAIAKHAGDGAALRGIFTSHSRVSSDEAQPGREVVNFSYALEPEPEEAAAFLCEALQYVHRRLHDWEYVAAAVMGHLKVAREAYLDWGAMPVLRSTLQTLFDDWNSVFQPTRIWSQFTQPEAEDRDVDDRQEQRTQQMPWDVYLDESLEHEVSLGEGLWHLCELDRWAKTDRTEAAANYLDFVLRFRYSFSELRLFRDDWVRNLVFDPKLAEDAWMMAQPILERELGRSASEPIRSRLFGS